jgi:hypothetical protein
MDIQVVLGVVPLFVFSPTGRSKISYTLPHAWLETENYIIDTNPQQVEYWEGVYWKEGPEQPEMVGKDIGDEPLNLKIIPKSDPLAKKYYKDVDEAFYAFGKDKNWESPRKWSENPFVGLPYASEYKFTMGYALEHLYGEGADLTEDNLGGFYDMILDGKVSVDMEHVYDFEQERFEKHKKKRAKGKKRQPSIFSYQRLQDD